MVLKTPLSAFTEFIYLWMPLNVAIDLTDLVLHDLYQRAHSLPIVGVLVVPTLPYEGSSDEPASPYAR